VGFSGHTRNIFLVQLRQQLPSWFSGFYPAHAVVADGAVTVTDVKGDRARGSFWSTPTHLQLGKDLLSASPASSNVKLLSRVLCRLHQAVAVLNFAPEVHTVPPDDSDGSVQTIKPVMTFCTTNMQVG
jgi:hypothetical protein